MLVILLLWPSSGKEINDSLTVEPPLARKSMISNKDFDDLLNCCSPSSSKELYNFPAVELSLKV